MQERVASPLMCTVHAPQSAMPQPNLVPVMFSVSRSTQSSGMSGLTSTDWGLPFKVKLMAMGTSSSQMDILQQLPVWMKIRGEPVGRSADGPRKANTFMTSEVVSSCKEIGTGRLKTCQRV